MGKVAWCHTEDMVIVDGIKDGLRNGLSVNQAIMASVPKTKRSFDACQSRWYGVLKKQYIKYVTPSLTQTTEQPQPLELVNNLVDKSTNKPVGTAVNEVTQPLVSQHNVDLNFPSTSLKWDTKYDDMLLDFVQEGITAGYKMSEIIGELTGVFNCTTTELNQRYEKLTKQNQLPIVPLPIVPSPIVPSPIVPRIEMDPESQLPTPNQVVKDSLGVNVESISRDEQWRLLMTLVGNLIKTESTPVVDNTAENMLIIANLQREIENYKHKVNKYKEERNEYHKKYRETKYTLHNIELILNPKPQVNPTDDQAINYKVGDDGVVSLLR